jgi:ATP-dependent DNA helicase DinG
VLNSYKNEVTDIPFVYCHTGLKEDNGNRVYSISVCLLKDNGQLITLFDELVAYSYFTGRDRHYSNLSKKKLDNATQPAIIANELKKLLSKYEFVISLNNQNNHKDIRDYCGVNRVVDLRFATDYFLPYLEINSPKHLWEHLYKLKRDKVSFSSESIVRLQIELVKHICGYILNENNSKNATVLRFFLNKSDTLFGTLFIHISKNYNAYFPKDNLLLSPYTNQDTENWRLFLEQKEDNSPETIQRQEQRNILLNSVEDKFSQLSKSGIGYKLRNSQIKYSKDISNSINNETFLLIEAGTGTGKTFGYLIPIFEYLYRNPHERFAISTYTKNLQDQIFSREIDTVKRVFKEYKNINVKLLKGRSSYVCVEKLDNIYSDDLSGKELLTWLYFLNITYNFRRVDTDSIKESIKYYLGTDTYYSQALNEISAETGCSYKHNNCPTQVLSCEAANAQLVITNHFKLVHFDSDPSLSGLFNNFFIDEASLFERAVRSSLSKGIKSSEIVDILNFLKPLLKNIRNKSKDSMVDDITVVLNELNLLAEEILVFNNALLSIRPDQDIGEPIELPISNPCFIDGHVKNNLLGIETLLFDIYSKLCNLQDDDKVNDLKIHGKTRKRLESTSTHILAFLDSIKKIISNIENGDYVCTFRSYYKNWIINLQTVGVASLIKEHIYKKRDRVIFTGASLLSKNKDFSMFREIVGLKNQVCITSDIKKQKEVVTISIPSPFHSNQMEIIVPPDAANGGYDNKKAWLVYIIKTVPELIIKNRGRSLVLFASYDDLEDVAAELNHMPELSDYPMLIQEKGKSTNNLSDEFRTIKESVLFGVDTFWFGVDYQGDTLTQVIITRLPLPNIYDPMQVAKKKLLTHEQFMEIYHYDAFIKMKQGIGRLIRSERDKGSIYILDSRYFSYPELEFTPSDEFGGVDRKLLIEMFHNDYSDMNIHL